MHEYQYVTLRDKPEWKDAAAAWFHEKWGVPTQAYLDCMNVYLQISAEKKQAGHDICVLPGLLYEVKYDQGCQNSRREYRTLPLYPVTVFAWSMDRRTASSVASAAARKASLIWDS